MQHRIEDYRRELIQMEDQNGVRTVLEERSINTKGLVGDEVRNILAHHSNFLHEKTKLQKEVERRDYLMFYLPKLL